MTDWPEVALGDAMSLDLETVEVEPDATYDVVGVLNRGRGLLRREPMSGSGTAYKNLNVIRPRQVVYSRLKAFEGAITVVPGKASASFASQEFPTFTCGPDLLPEYFALHTTTAALWGRLQGLSTGMGGRRERVKPTDFLTIRIPLPPLAEQRRIVDLMASIDQQTAALAQELENGARTRTAMLDSLLASGDEVWATEPLGALGTFTRGRRFTKLDYVDSGLGCIHYGQIYTEFGAIARFTSTFLPVEYKERMRMAEPGDLIIAATGEDRVAVGKAVAWLGESAVAVHDDAQIFRHRLDARYAAYVTETTAFQLQKMRLVSDMKVARVASKDLACIRVPVPPRKDQARIADAVEALDVKQDAASSESEYLHAFRSALLAALLNQDREIPASYDRLLQEVE